MTTKIFPPFGKQLNQIRCSGLIPRSRVIVSTRWKLGAAYPRIVIPDDVAIEKFNFSYLAGLNVQIVHQNNEGQLVLNLIDAILKIKPKVLTIFNCELAKQGTSDRPTMYLIHPEPTELINGL